MNTIDRDGRGGRNRPEEGASATVPTASLSGPGTPQVCVLAPECLRRSIWRRPSATESGLGRWGAVGHTFVYYPPSEVGDVSEPPPLQVSTAALYAAAEWRRADVRLDHALPYTSTIAARPIRPSHREALWERGSHADCAVAEGLAQRGLADPDRLFIRGGSAGGFTALAAVTFHDTFAAAASSYGIADLALLAAETHKFESRYLDGLVGPYPEQAQVYAARSPLFHVDTIDVPVLVLQGSDDPVVPPSQADALVDALRSRGGRVEERRYEGEAHGWRRAQTIIDALETELNFFLSI
jgi:dienelactone hydrolase